MDNLSREDFGCQVSCEGLYADVTKHDVVQNEQYKKIEEEYRNYRKMYFKNIQYRPRFIITGTLYYVLYT